MVKRRRRKPTEQAEVVEANPAVSAGDVERYVRWRNDTGRSVTGIIVKEKEVDGWFPTRVFSLPESCSEQCEDAGLTRVGFARA
jgi:hypothetical protein